MATPTVVEFVLFDLFDFYTSHNLYLLDCIAKAGKNIPTLVLVRGIYKTCMLLYRKN